MKDLNNRIVFTNGQFLRKRNFTGLKMLYPDVAEETEDFLADGVLKAVGKCHGNNHRCYADNGGSSGQADDETRERALPVERKAAGDKNR